MQRSVLIQQLTYPRVIIGSDDIRDTNAQISKAKAIRDAVILVQQLAYPRVIIKSDDISGDQGDKENFT
jgi:hypothetical protein